VRTMRAGATRLREALIGEGGTVAAVLAGPSADDARLARSGPAQLAAAGPRARGHEDEYELLLEMILEGSRLHYGEALVVHPDDPDLALLLGDQLYALGLSRLAALGDLEAVAELADVISIVAQAHAASSPALAGAAWEAGAVAVGWGGSPRHAAAKALARSGSPDAAQALSAVALSAQTKRS
jgi:hypothetical protein